jgi:hypothetical protein
MHPRRILRLLSLITLAALFAADSGYAQAYEGRACRSGNQQLKQLIARGAAPGLRLETGRVGTADLWATSFLPAEGARPARPADHDEITEGESYLHEWTCMYAASRLSDGDVATAWAEGVSGDGIGEIVLLPLDTSKPIRIRAGFAKSPALYAANNRPRDVKLYVVSTGGLDATQSGAIYENLSVVLTHSVRLADRNEFQIVTLPPHTPGNHSILAIEILSVYRGTRYRDTLISEISN